MCQHNLCVSGSDWTVRDCRQSLPNLLVCQEDEAYYASAVKTFWICNVYSWIIFSAFFDYFSNDDQPLGHLMKITDSKNWFTEIETNMK